MTTFEEALNEIIEKPESWDYHVLHNECFQHETFKLLIHNLAIKSALTLATSDASNIEANMCAQAETLFLLGMHIGLKMNRSDWEPKI